MKHFLGAVTLLFMTTFAFGDHPYPYTSLRVVSMLPPYFASGSAQNEEVYFKFHYFQDMYWDEFGLGLSEIASWPGFPAVHYGNQLHTRSSWQDQKACQCLGTYHIMKETPPRCNPSIAPTHRCSCPESSIPWPMPLLLALTATGSVR